MESLFLLLYLGDTFHVFALFYVGTLTIDGKPYFLLFRIVASEDLVL